MADEQFDSSAARSRRDQLMDEIRPIRTRLSGIVEDYYEYTPTSEEDERDMRARIRRRIIDEERALRALADRV